MQQWPVTRSKIIRYMFHTKHNFGSIHSSKFEPHELKENIKLIQLYLHAIAR